MKKLNFLFFLALGSLLLSSCLKNNDGPTPTFRYGGMIYINAYPDAFSTYFRIDEKSIQFPGNDKGIPYKSIGPLIHPFPGSHRFEVFSANHGNNTLIIDTSITIRDSTYYSSIIFGDKVNPKYLLATDVPLADLNNGSAVRFFNLANELEDASLFFDDKAITAFGNRPQASDSTLIENQKFQALSSGGVTITAKDKEGNEFAKRENFQFQKDRYYTIILIGTKSNTDTPYYLGVVAH